MTSLSPAALAEASSLPNSSSDAWDLGSRTNRRPPGFSVIVPLAAFSERVGALLVGDRERLPLRLGRFLDYMLAEELFVSYREPAGIDRALRGIALRSRRAAPLRDGVRELERNYDGLREDFHAFFPQIVAKAENLSRPSGESHESDR